MRRSTPRWTRNNTRGNQYVPEPFDHQPIHDHIHHVDLLPRAQCSDSRVIARCYCIGLGGPGCGRAGSSSTTSNRRWSWVRGPYVRVCQHRPRRPRGGSRDPVRSAAGAWGQRRHHPARAACERAYLRPSARRAETSRREMLGLHGVVELLDRPHRARRRPGAGGGVSLWAARASAMASSIGCTYMVGEACTCWRVQPVPRCSRPGSSA